MGTKPGGVALLNHTNATIIIISVALLVNSLRQELKVCTRTSDFW